jgi:hypothetical protein
LTDTATDREHQILEKVQKLLSVQGRTPEETAAYAAKAQELMEAYNLDLARLDEVGEGGRRAEEKFLGGFYEFERELWTYVADLNFCLYWAQRVRVSRTKRDARSEALVSRLARETVVVRQHRLVGRRVNVIAAQNMATYLLGAIEATCRDWLGEGRSAGDLRSRRAVSFREGAAHDIVTRLWERRQTQVREDERREREAAVAAGLSGVSTATALTLSTHRRTEEEANYDHIYGEGWSARRAARVAAQAQAEREAQEAYTQWAEANPEEARRKEQERVKSERRRSRAPRQKERDWGAFGSGQDAGASISIDQQVGERSSALLPRSQK